jgi:hypothetical protein
MAYNNELYNIELADQDRAAINQDRVCGGVRAHSCRYCCMCPSQSLGCAAPPSRVALIAVELLEPQCK